MLYERSRRISVLRDLFYYEITAVACTVISL